MTDALHLMFYVQDNVKRAHALKKLINLFHASAKIFKEVFSSYFLSDTWLSLRHYCSLRKEESDTNNVLSR